jgi:hypothetical protein
VEARAIETPIIRIGENHCAALMHPRDISTRSSTDVPLKRRGNGQSASMKSRFPSDNKSVTPLSRQEARSPSALQPINGDIKDTHTCLSVFSPLCVFQPAG